MSRPVFHALLVGINRYLHRPDLNGCVADVARAEAFLRTAAGADGARVRTLTDAQATRAGLLAAFVALADDETIGPDDQVLIHFSGHGAQMRDPLDQSPSGYIECLVPHDSGPKGAFGIPDRTIGALLARLTRRTPHVTVVFDCCHSGNATRDERAPRARLAEPDGRPVPPDLDVGITGGRFDFDNPFTGRTLPYTLLAACRDRELAQEHVSYVGDTARHSGLLTHVLYDAFEEAAPGTSYAALMEQVAGRVTAVNRYQHPQCEGRVHRVLFDGADVRRDPFMTVADVLGEQLVLDAGLLHGLVRGQSLALYPATVQTRDALPETPWAMATVTHVEPTSSRATLDVDGEPPPTPDTMKHARAVPLGAGVAPEGGRVQFVGVDGARPLELPPSLKGAWTPVSGGADLRVVADGARAWVADSADRMITRPVPVHDPRQVADALDIIARFDRLARLHNPDPASRLQGQLSLSLRRHRRGTYDTQQMPPVPAVDGERVLPYDPGAPPVDYLVEVHNGSDRKVHVALLLLSADYSIIQLYPRFTSDVALDPGRTLAVGVNNYDELIRAWLPDSPWWVQAANRVLLVATPRPARFDVLEQPGLGSFRGPSAHTDDPLGALLRDCAEGRRMLRRRASEDWGTASMAVTVVRAPHSVVLRPGSNRLPGGIDLQTDAPARIVAGTPDQLRLAGVATSLPVAALRDQGLLAMPAPGQGVAEAPWLLQLQGGGHGGVVVRTADRRPLTPMAVHGATLRAAGRALGPGVGRIAPGSEGLMLMAGPG